MLYLDSTVVGAAYSRWTSRSAEGSVIIAGLGDPSRGDEGAGVEVTRRLDFEPKIPGVRIICAGPCAHRILGELHHCRALIIVAAAFDAGPAGSVHYAKVCGCGCLPCGVSANRWELGEVLTTAHVAGVLPSLHFYTISIHRQARHAPRLSFATAAGVAVATCMVHGHAVRLMSRSDAA